MAKRVTIRIDDEADRMVRQHRTQKMLDTNRACSYSAAINDLLARSL